MAAMSPPPVDTPPLMTQDTSPGKNRMRRGFGSSGRTLSLVHFCIQNEKFKAFSLNEMKAMVQIVAESEFVCAKRLRIFLERFLV
jgi:hypothetical protein